MTSVRVVTRGEDLAPYLSSCMNPVAFTGAGISYASGLPVFGSQWRGRPLLEWLTLEQWSRDPQGFYQLYWEQMMHWPKAEPNAAHKTLAALGCLVITQNFDGLHQKAGSRRVLELHGNLVRLRCPQCEVRYPSVDFVGNLHPSCPVCKNLLRPDLVLAGEPTQNWWAAVHAVEHCDLLLVVGTSLDFRPAKRLPELAERAGAQVIVVNRSAEVILPHAWQLCSATRR